MSEEEKLTIEVVFDEPTSSIFTVNVTGNVLPYQLLMLGSYFEFEGKLLMSRIRDAQMAQIMEQQEKNKIAVPSSKIVRK